MKKKKEIEKLVLNKISIAKLDNDNMNQVKGGVSDGIIDNSVSKAGNSCITS